MPMIWNAEADAKLLAAIMQVYEVRPSSKKLQEVAALMGPECTAKALTHRLAKFRNLAKDGEKSPTKTTPAKTTPAKDTPKSAGRKRKADTMASDDEEDDETATTNETPSRGRTKRAVPKQSYAESDDEGNLSVKIKAEAQMEDASTEHGGKEGTMGNTFD